MTKDKLKDYEGIKCPAGGTFGKSFFDYGYICEDCELFEPCADKIEELYGPEASDLKLGFGQLPRFIKKGLTIYGRKNSEEEMKMKHSDVNHIALLFELAKEAGALEVLFNVEHHFIHIKPDGPLIDLITNQYRKIFGWDINEKLLDDPPQVRLMEEGSGISQINPANLISKISKNDLATVKIRPSFLRAHVNTYFIVDAAESFDAVRIQYINGEHNGLTVILPKETESIFLTNLYAYGLYPEGTPKYKINIGPAIFHQEPATVLTEVNSIISNALKSVKSNLN